MNACLEFTYEDIERHHGDFTLKNYWHWQKTKQVFIITDNDNKNCIDLV